jgi:hypothetical protein
MQKGYIPMRAGAGMLLLSLMACRPVFAIGWEELVVVAGIIALLLGPFLLRLGRSWHAYQESKKKKG